jgi:hypothetical protein
MHKNFLIFVSIALLSVACCAQTYARYSAPFPSVSSINNTAFLVANIAPNLPVLAVCNHPANQVPCTNYATTYTSGGVACPNGAQDTPDPQPSACQGTGDAQGNIGFFAPAGEYDYTVCIQNSVSCFGPYTITLALGNGTGLSPGGSSGNLQYNNAGAFGGVANTSVNGSGDIVGSGCPPGSYVKADGSGFCGLPFAGSAPNLSSYLWLPNGGSSLTATVPATCANSALATGYLEMDQSTASVYLLEPTASGTSTGSIAIQYNALSLVSATTASGIAIWNSANNQSIILIIQAGVLYVQEYTSNNSFQSTVLMDDIYSGGFLQNLRVSFNGTNFLFYASVDGVHWILAGSQAMSTWVGTPTHYGFVLNADSASSGAVAGMSMIFVTTS